MTTNIKFQNNLQKEFVVTLRKKVSEYFKEKGITKFGNTNMVIKTIFMFALYLTPYILMITGVFTHPLMVFALWIIMGVGMAGIGLSVMHDANHKSYSKYKTVNTILSYSLNFLGGFSPTWKHQHNTLHHSFTNIDGFDEDIAPPSVLLRFSPNKPLYKVHKFQHFYAWFFYGLLTLTWTIDKDFRQVVRYKKEGAVLNSSNSSTILLSELIISKILYYSYILVLPILLLPISWWVILLFYFSMHFVSGFILGVIFQTAHVMPTSKFPIPDKDGTMENNWAIHQLLTTTNFAPKNGFFSWFIGGLNYQVEHHLFPTICHVHYRNISQIVQETAKSFNLPYHVQPTFVIALWKHMKMLKALGSLKKLQATAT